MLFKLLTLPVSGPIDGVLWLADKLGEQAENELYNEPAVRGKLVELEMQLEAGAISEAEYEAAEEVLLARLREIRKRKAG